MLLSRPQGEPQGPLPPDAAQWNAGVRIFPEVSLWPPPANQRSLVEPLWLPPSQSGPKIYAPGRGVFQVLKDPGR